MARSRRHIPIFHWAHVRTKPQGNGRRHPRKQWKQEQSRAERRRARHLLLGDGDGQALARFDGRGSNYKDPGDGRAYQRRWGYRFIQSWRPNAIVWVEVSPTEHFARAMRK